MAGMRALAFAVFFGISCGYPKEYVQDNKVEGDVMCGIEMVLAEEEIFQLQTTQAEIRIILKNGEKVPGDGSGIIWESADPDIARADENGYITGIKEGSTEIRARLGEYTASSTIKVRKIIDCTRVLLSEVFYDAAGSDTGLEFIEIFNAGDDECNISSYRLIDGLKTSTPFVFPENTNISPGQFFIIAASEGGFKGFFGISPDYAGFTFSLNNSGETVIFYKSDDSIQDILYIEGGYGEFLPDSAWGSNTLPMGNEGESVKRIDFNTNRTNLNWIKGAPNPGSL